MESLSDLLRHLPQNAWMKQAQENTRKLFDDPLIQSLRAVHPILDDHTLKLHQNVLYQYVKENQHCGQCPGLAACPNDYQGHYTQLEVSQTEEVVYIQDRKTPCMLWKAQTQQQAIRRRVHSFYADVHALGQGYSTEEIFMKDPERQLAVRTLVKYISDVKEKGLPKQGLFLVGEFGTGKTFLMGYMLHELAKSGYSGAIVYMPDFIEDLKSMFQDPQKLKSTIDTMKEADLLILDDLGAENLSPWARDHVLGTILNYRMNRKPTFFTSNYELDQLEKHFSFTNKDGEEEFKGQRIMDRIRPFVEVIYVGGSNKRGNEAKY